MASVAKKSIPLRYYLLNLFNKWREPEKESEKSKSNVGPWDDNPITKEENDDFLYRDYAELLADRVTQSDTPLTIGILGSWGSGKTSIMNLVKKNLATVNTVNIQSIWVNVWQLSTQDEVGHALMQALFSKVNKELSFWKRLDKRKFLQVLLENLYRAVLVCTPMAIGLFIPGSETGWADSPALQTLIPGISTLLTVGLGWWTVIKPIKPIIEKVREVTAFDVNEVLKFESYEAQITELQDLRDRFERMVETLVQEKGLSRVAIFIDDLDRCAPNKIADVLEALKLFGSAEHCVFLLGIDDNIVLQALAQKYQFTKADEAKAYMEKIVQVPFRVPPIRQDRMTLFVRGKYGDIDRTAPEAARIFTAGLQPNPRQIKRTLNIFRTRLEIAEQRWRRFELDFRLDAALLAKLVIVQQQSPEAYTQIARNPVFIKSLEYWARHQYLTQAAPQPAPPEPVVMDRFCKWLPKYIKNAETAQKARNDLIEIEDLTLADLDIDPKIFEILKSGRAYFKDVPDEQLLWYVQLSKPGRISTPNIELVKKAESLKARYSSEINEDLFQYPALIQGLEYQALKLDLQSRLRDLYRCPLADDVLEPFLQWLQSRVKDAELIEKIESKSVQITDLPFSVFGLERRLITALAQGESRFNNLTDRELSVYIHLDDDAYQNPFETQILPLKQRDKLLLLSGKKKEIETFLTNKVQAHNHSDDRELQKQEIEQFLQLAVAAPIDRITPSERLSANYALDRLTRRSLKPFEPETVRIPEGTFLMGSGEQEALSYRGDDYDLPSDIGLPEVLADRYPDEYPQHEVYLSEYRIGRFPVTNRQYKEFIVQAKHQPPVHWQNGEYPEKMDDSPVTGVSWEDANAYCQWLTQTTRKEDYRLPTEAEWEKAARGTDERVYPWGNQWDPARLNHDSLDHTSPVGAYSPEGDSPYGIADMAGNVLEWCEDIYVPDLYENRAGAKVRDPENRGKEDRSKVRDSENQGEEDQSKEHVLRGSSGINYKNSVRCSNRSSAKSADYHTGFRVVLSRRDRLRQWLETDEDDLESVSVENPEPVSNSTSTEVGQANKECLSE